MSSSVRVTSKQGCIYYPTISDTFTEWVPLCIYSLVSLYGCGYSSFICIISVTVKKGVSLMLKCCTRLQRLVCIECARMTFDLYSSSCRYLVRAGTSSLFPSLLIDQVLKLIDEASDELRFSLSSPSASVRICRAVSVASSCRGSSFIRGGSLLGRCTAACLFYFSHRKTVSAIRGHAQLSQTSCC